jgi:hypothetical protein
VYFLSGIKETTMINKRIDSTETDNTLLPFFRDGDSILFDDLDAATPSLHTGVRVLVSAHNTSIESDISHSSIAGSGTTVKDVPDARIFTLTGLEEVCIVNCD